jgi:D-inositol-3-phosphate glycosyltransferase
MTGLLVPPGKPAGYARALADVLLDAARAAAMGAAGVRFAGGLDWRRAAAGLLAVYEDLACVESGAASS